MSVSIALPFERVVQIGPFTTSPALASADVRGCGTRPTIIVASLRFDVVRQYRHAMVRCRYIGCYMRKPVVVGSDARVPLVPLVLPVAAVSAGDVREALDELDAHHVLRVLVAQLALDAKADRRAVPDRQ